ncbi:MAG: LytTR family DNA-binding domain-containing protein, partial [Pseudomonadota bacterium]
RSGEDDPSQPQTLAIRKGDDIEWLRTRDIRWIGAAGNYVEVHALDRLHVVRGNIGSVETTLGPACFARVHRSALVNVDHVQGLRRRGRQWSVQLSDGTLVPVGRRRVAAVRARIRPDRNRL